MAELENVTEVAEVPAQAEANVAEKTARTERENRKPRGFKRNQGNKNEKPSDGFDKKMVAVNRISKTVKGGRKMRFNALVVVGDRNGKIGIGMGKAAEVTLAIEKATSDAKKHVVSVDLHGTTIPHEVVGIFETTKVYMMPAKEGNGVIAGGAVRDVVDLAGVRDITTKLYGSNNPVNCVKAAFDGLTKLRNAERIAALRGKSVDEIR